MPENRTKLRIMIPIFKLMIRARNKTRILCRPISAVDLSGDLGVARVAFSTLRPDEDPEPAAAALKKAGGFLRSRAGRILGMRRVPELHFEQDQAARQGIELTRLIDEVVAKDRDTSQATDDPAQEL